MNNKSGISLAILVASIAIMLILISVAGVVGSQAITTANFEDYMSEIRKVSNDVNEYFLENSKLPITGEVISPESLGASFTNNLVKNNDMENRLFVMDISKVEDSTLKYGKGQIISKDIFVVAENTHNVYYLKGFDYKSVIYYGM